MNPREIVRLRLNEGDEVTATEGVIWLTFEGRDFVLQSGQSFFALARGEAMLEGLGGVPWQFQRRGGAPAPPCSLGQVLRLWFDARVQMNPRPDARSS